MGTSRDALRRRARRITAFGRGLLALDTPPAALAVRLRAAAVVPTAAAAAAYRATLLATPELDAQVSGVVLPPWDLRCPPGVLAASGPTSGSSRSAPTRPRSSRPGSTGWPRGCGGSATRARRSPCGAPPPGRPGAPPPAPSSPTRPRPPGSPPPPGRRAGARRPGGTRLRHRVHVGLVPVVRVGTRLRHGSTAQRREVRAAAVLVVCAAAVELDVDLPALVLSTTVEPDDDGVLFTALPAALGGVAVGPSLDAVRTPPACPVTFYAGRAVTWPALRAWRGDPGAARAGQEALRGGLAAAAS
ncbi:hypothetical protein BJF78_33395 [Pseudonocardia sp. CNS-139]|nr:hypothetical protein BJF78_33395 [Pseudonocardia sp. CNS-139]